MSEILMPLPSVQYLREMILIMTKKQNIDFIQNCINSIKNSSATEKQKMREIYYQQKEFFDDVIFEPFLSSNLEEEIEQTEIIPEASITVFMDISQSTHITYGNTLNEASINDSNDFAA